MNRPARMRPLVGGLLLLLLLLPSLPVRARSQAAADTTGFQPLLSFPVTDTVEAHTAPLGERLMVRVRHEDDGISFGWSAGVYRLPVGPSRRNLLYHSLRWHGPYPTELFAWSHRSGYFPDDRILPVYGWPYDLYLVCRACVTEGDSAVVHFTSGTVEVAWRRLPHPNPGTMK